MHPMSTPPITVDDVLRCDSQWRECEIWDGVPMVRSPSGGWAEAVGSRVIGPLNAFVREHDLGWVFMSSQGFLLARDPDRMLASDGAYVSSARLPKLPRRGFIELAPDFLIEVRSPEDPWEAVVEKCGVWLAHGARCAWGIDPDQAKVAVFRPGVAPEVLRGAGTARADPALDGFEIALVELFAGLV